MTDPKLLERLEQAMFDFFLRKCTPQEWKAYEEEQRRERLAKAAGEARARSE